MARSASVSLAGGILCALSLTLSLKQGMLTQVLVDDVVTSPLAFRLGSGAFGCSRAKKINSGPYRSGAGTSVHNLTMDTLISTEGKLVWTSPKQPEINPKVHFERTNNVGTEAVSPSQIDV